MGRLINIAFKEWAIVDEALGAGRQSILIRKGGIHERHGRFAVEHSEFLIYPTYLHQSPAMLKPGTHPPAANTAASPAHGPQQMPNSDGIAGPQAPPRITIRHLAQVTDVLHAANADAAGAWDEFHIYSPELIRSRFRYKPERPLFVLLVRIFRLPTPAVFLETPAYAGCRSWVQLETAVETGSARPVMDESAFSELSHRVRAAFSP